MYQEPVRTWDSDGGTWEAPPARTVKMGHTTNYRVAMTASSQLVKHRELPKKFHPLLRQSAGHCRSRKESHVVMKLLEAVRSAAEIVEAAEAGEGRAGAERGPSSPLGGPGRGRRRRPRSAPASKSPGGRSDRKRVG